jgi:hypothetical protein
MTLSNCEQQILTSIANIGGLKDAFISLLTTTIAALTVQLTTLQLQLERMRIVSNFYSTILTTFDSTTAQFAANISTILRPDIRIAIEGCDEFSQTLDVVNTTTTDKTRLGQKYDSDKQLEAIRKLEDRILGVSAAKSRLEEWKIFLQELV